MMDLNRMPERIKKQIEGKAWCGDDVGMSKSEVVLFEDMVLKVEEDGRSPRNECALLKWLDGKLPVPRVIEAELQDGYSYLLMSKLRGEMAYSDVSLKDIDATVMALAHGLKMLWAVDMSGCPCSNVVDEKLAQARHRIAHGQVDMDDFEPETFGPGGFEDVHALYDYLEQNRPTEELVFSHGDYCLPNVFVKDGEAVGFIDWGTGGIADRWQDIALCVRSLRHNMVACAGYGEADYLRHVKMLFEAIGMEPDEDKIRYYILLDELF